MRRAARGLVEARSERFMSRYPIEESQRRLAAALAKAPVKHLRFSTAWEAQGGKAALLAGFAPSPRTQAFLKALSIGMALLVAASIWAWRSGETAGSAALMLPVIAVLAVLGFPFLVLGLASHREAEEARIRKAIRVALQDAEENLPPRQRWQDED